MSTTAISEIQLFNTLKLKLGEKEAEELVSFVKDNIESEIKEQTSYLANKEDIARLETKISDTKTDVIKWVFSFFITLALMIIGLYIKK